MENIITEYAVATGTNHKELILAVQEGIQKGWQPWHGVFTTFVHNVSYIHQAMVMYEVKKKSTK